MWTNIYLRWFKWMFLCCCLLRGISSNTPSSSSSSSSSNATDSALCESPATQRHGDKQIIIGVILPFEENTYWRINLTEPALLHAIDYIKNSTDLLRNYTIKLDLRDSKCSETNGPLEAIDMYTKKSADVFFGPACDYAVAPIARFTPTWDIPLITAGALVKAFSNKDEYKLLTRVHGVYDKAAEFLVSVLENFNWMVVGMLLHDPGDPQGKGRSQCWFTMESVFLAIQHKLNPKLDMKFVETFDETNSTADIEGRLKLLSNKCRVLVLCASPHSVREIMIKAHELEFDNGEYVFFNIDLFTSKNSSERPWYNETDTADRNEKARKAYEALMTVTLRKPTNQKYREFSQDVKKRAQKLYKNFTYGEDEVNSFVGAFHDAVILYAIALNESLAANVSISNGSEITRRMWNKTFTGITGNVSIDENGDRNADYSLLDMDPKTSEFRVVANYYGNRKQYEPVNGVQIHWAGGRSEPPPDTPECGFDGSKCPPEEPFPLYVIVIIVLGSVIIVVLIISFFVYRRNDVLRAPDADTCDLQRT